MHKMIIKRYYLIIYWLVHCYGRSALLCIYVSWQTFKTFHILNLDDFQNRHHVNPKIIQHVKKKLDTQQMTLLHELLLKVKVLELIWSHNFRHDKDISYSLFVSFSLCQFFTLSNMHPSNVWACSTRL